MKLNLAFKTWTLATVVNYERKEFCKIGHSERGKNVLVETESDIFISLIFWMLKRCHHIQHIDTLLNDT